MATDALSERLSSKLHLQTKTVGDERIRRAKEKDEDVAIFSMFPMEGDPKFRCCLGKDCLIGDPKKADPGDNRDNRIQQCIINIIINMREIFVTKRERIKTTPLDETMILFYIDQLKEDEAH